MSKVEKPPPAAVSLSATEIAIKQKKEGLTVQNATTADALKRLSKEKTRLALDDPNTCIAGITTNKNDPFIIALEQSTEFSAKTKSKKISKKITKNIDKTKVSGQKLLFMSTSIGCRVVDSEVNIAAGKDLATPADSVSLATTPSFSSTESSCMVNKGTFERIERRSRNPTEMFLRNSFHMDEEEEDDDMFSLDLLDKHHSGSDGREDSSTLGSGNDDEEEEDTDNEEMKNEQYDKFN